MKLSQIAIKAIKENKRLRTRIALEMNKHTGTIDRWIEANEANGELTTIRVFQLVAEETGLTYGEMYEGANANIEPQAA